MQMLDPPSRILLPTDLSSDTEFVAETVDLSRSGVLLRMDSGLADQGLNLPYFALQVQCHFADGCEAVLSGYDKPVQAKIVRATEREGHLLVAFRFDKRLPPKVCEALGIPVSGEDIPEPAQE